MILRTATAGRIATADIDLFYQTSEILWQRLRSGSKFFWYPVLAGTAESAALVQSHLSKLMAPDDILLVLISPKKQQVRADWILC